MSGEVFIERDKAQYTAMKINKSGPRQTQNRHLGDTTGEPAPFPPDKLQGKRALPWFFFPLLMYEILCVIFCMQRIFFTYPSVPDSIDGLFKVLKPCWLGKCLWWTIKFPATPLTLFSLLLAKNSPSSVTCSWTVFQELTGYWKGSCVTLNTATVLRNSNRIISVPLDVFWKKE